MRELFATTTLGATVVIEGDAARHVRTSDASLLAPSDVEGKPMVPVGLDGRPFTWNPERSADGPITVIASKSDQRIVVLRGGVEIGRSIAQIDDDDPGSHVVTLSRGPDGAPRCVYVGLPDHEAEENHVLDEAILSRLRLPRGFYKAVTTVLRPGATILITQSGVGTSPRDPVTIMDAVMPQPDPPLP